MKKYLFFSGKIAVSFFILLYFFSQINREEYAKLLANIDLKFFFLALFFYFLNLIIFSFKWQVLIKMMRLESSFRALLKNNFISLFYGLFLPGGFLSGELVKCYKISRGSEAKTKLIFSVFLDRLTGVLSFLTIGFAFFIYSENFRDDFFWLYLFLFLSGLAVYAGLIVKPLRQKAKFCIFFVLSKIKPNFALAEDHYIRPAYINIAIVWGFLFQITLSTAVYFVIRSLDCHVPLFDVIWIYSLVSIVVMIPISFLGIGLRDFSLVYFLGKFGLPIEAGIGAATLIVLLLIIRGLPGGLIELKSLFFKDDNH